MKIKKIIVNTPGKQYGVYVGNNIITTTSTILKKKLPDIKKVAIIYDSNIPKNKLKKLKLSLKNYSLSFYKFNSVDKIKNIKVATYLIENIIKKNFNRSDCIIAFGGGVLGDLAAFVSSVVKRGVRFVNIPTTLLSQVDASVGGKTAINSNQGKNLIGTFYQPEFIITDTSMLETLPFREMICGYGEILKHSLILDRKFFIWLTKNGKKIIHRNKKALEYSIIKSCKIKSRIINLDEKEKNLRMVLNFGHTFGHAFEGVKNFSKKLNHGEAVLLGMMIACEFSHKNKFLSPKDFSLIKDHYKSLKLPKNIKNYFDKKDVNKIIKFMLKDKKNYNNKLNLILLKKIGQSIRPGKFLADVNKVKKFLNLKLSN